MLGSLIKYIAFYLLGNRLSAAKNELRQVKETAADYAEERATLIKDNALQDASRVVNSLIALLIMFCAVIFSGLLGMMWLFASAWDSPHRAMILTIAIVIPLCISGIIFAALSYSWRKKPLLNGVSELIASDWQIFRSGLLDKSDTPKESTDKTPE